MGVGGGEGGVWLPGVTQGCKLTEMLPLMHESSMVTLGLSHLAIRTRRRENGIMRRL